VQLSRLVLRNFRNIEAAEIAWSPALTVLVGRNGQGKTNVLEAASLAVSRQALRAKSERELTRFGTDGYHLAATLTGEGGEEQSATRSVWLHPPRRKVAGPEMPVVTFSPDDLAVVKGSPDGRREFFDRMLNQLFARYRREWSRYQRAVAQRNRAIKEDQADAVLQGFEPLLAESGAYCWQQRAWLVHELGPLVVAVYQTLAPSEAPQLALVPGGSDVVLDRGGLESLLDRTRAQDRRRGATSVGPHRDDVRLLVTGVDGRLLSQGQQRTLVLALHLASRRLLERELGVRPLLVLDDVLSELDSARRHALLEVVTAVGQQSIVTDVTDVSTVDGRDARGVWPLAAWRYRVADGRISALDPIP
jgi:DNA replication and repair protein RecF